VIDPASADRSPPLGDLSAYQRRFPAENETVQRFYALLAAWPQCLSRDHMPGHITASGWVVHPETDSVLLTHHRKLDKWLQLGGHADGDPDPAAVAAREVLEESGLPLPRDAAELFDVDVHLIPCHRDVPEHYHYDLRYLFLVDERRIPVVSEESHDVAWVELGNLEAYTSEPSMLRMRRKWWSRRGRLPVG
jgi:8-oxo-dGTP pyrophosphatase MutT (NUDIX family)